MNIPQQYNHDLMQHFLTTSPEDDAAPIEEVAAAAQGLEMQHKKKTVDEFGAELQDRTALSARPVKDQGHDSVSISSQSSGDLVGSADGRGSHASRAGSRKGNQVEEKESFPKERQGNKKFQCTLCYRGYGTMHDWKKHEEKHYPQHKWVCMLNGATEVDHLGRPTCVFCGEVNADEEHCEVFHSFTKCYTKDQKWRSFAKEPILIEHVKQKHGVSTPYIHTERWRVHIDRGIMLCAFCSCQPDSWDSRAKHIAQHFMAGYDMANTDTKRPPPHKASKAWSTVCASCGGHTVTYWVVY